MAKKTDNHNLKGKLDLRRYFLAKYHADKPPAVLDCCQGGGLLWKALREEFPVASYWGIDLKAKPGRLKIDSARILSQPGWTQDVIDADVYGSPWKHWQAVLANGIAPLTVFLTRGSHSLEVLDAYEKAAIGLRFSLPIPGAFWPKLTMIDLALTYALTTCSLKDKIITEIVEAVSDGNARYVGIRLEAATTSSPQLLPASRSKPKRTTKESAHV